jgi:hypothetical protein
MTNEWVKGGTDEWTRINSRRMCKYEAEETVTKGRAAVRPPRLSLDELGMGVTYVGFSQVRFLGRLCQYFLKISYMMYIHDMTFLVFLVIIDM